MGLLFAKTVSGLPKSQVFFSREILPIFNISSFLLFKRFEYFDERMQPAIDVLIKKRKKNKFWLLQAKHPGQTHFDMEETGKPSRWDTLRTLRVLKHFMPKIGRGAF